MIRAVTTLSLLAALGTLPARAQQGGQPQGQTAPRPGSRKAKIAELHTAMTQIRGLRKNLNKSFWDIGGILREIQAKRLYEPRGFATFEAFVEREMDFGKTTSLRLVKINGVFQKEAALEHGMERVMNALMMLESPVEGVSSKDAKIPPAPISTSALPLKPPGRI